MGKKDQECQKDALGRCAIQRSIRSARLAKDAPQPQPFLMPTKLQTTSIESLKQADFDKKATSVYSMCDAPQPIIGTVCDNLNTSKGMKLTLVQVTAIILIGFVLLMDLLDFVVVALDIGTAIPIIGDFIGIITDLNIDDAIDFISMAIMFYYIGPITLVGIPEFANGFVEIIPFWWLMFLVWLFWIRPSRLRDITRQEQEMKAKIEEKKAP